MTASRDELGPRARLRVVVVDDEPLSRRALRQLLDPRSDIEVVAECASAVGLDAIARASDVLFVDVEMPVRSGLDLARTVITSRSDGGDDVSVSAAVGGPPFVVFVTAYDEYAVPAFDAGAVDYLTKPVMPARLERAIARVHARLAAVRALSGRLDRAAPLSADSPVAPDGPVSTLTAVRRSAPTPAALTPAALTSLVSRIGLREIVIPLATVALLEADGVYTAVHVGRRRHLIRRSLDDLQRVLCPAQFLRVHRSYLVRRSAIIEARLLGTGQRELLLSDGTTVPVSRRRQPMVARWLRA